MDDKMWKIFFEVCAEVLGKGSPDPRTSDSWCSWTTFDRLTEDAGYWTSGLPNPNELADTNVWDGGTWGQPFLYRKLAHIIIPRRFHREIVSEGKLTDGYKEQSVDPLSGKLATQGIVHRKTNLVLEIKLF